MPAAQRAGFPSDPTAKPNGVLQKETVYCYALKNRRYG